MISPALLVYMELRCWNSRLPAEVHLEAGVVLVVVAESSRRPLPPALQAVAVASLELELDDLNSSSSDRSRSRSHNFHSMDNLFLRSTVLRSRHHDIANRANYTPGQASYLRKVHTQMA